MRLLVTTRSGLYCLNDKERTVFGEDREFLALTRAPAPPDVCYAAQAARPIFRSEDGGRSWADTGRLEGFAELSCLEVDPRDPDGLLAGMEPSALFRSGDGGRTWEEDPAIRRMSQENGWSV